VPAAALELWRAFHDRDLERCRAAIPEDFVFHDHRRTGAGRIEGAEGWTAWNASLLEQSPDVISEPLYSIASDEHGSLAMGHTFGTLAGGGAFESVYLSLWHYRDGRPVALERFEPDDLELARARFEELRAGSA
jgi:ketosteroid isomerase-like protein